MVKVRAEILNEDERARALRTYDALVPASAAGLPPKSHGSFANCAAPAGPADVELSSNERGAPMMFRVLAAVAGAAFVAAGAVQAAPLSPLERQHLVAHLEMTASWLADELNGLTPAQADFRRQPGAWTIAEVLDHLLVVAPIYWQDLQSALKQPRGARRSAMSDADVLWYGIDRTNREQAIAGERLGGQLRDLRAGLETYRKHHDRLLQYVKTTDDDLREHIVPRQTCDAYQWALLISTHEQRHILQIREIKAAPGFPKK